MNLTGRKSGSYLIWLVFFHPSERQIFIAFVNLTGVRDIQTAVIKEGLRLGTIVPGRLPRVVPPEGIDHKGTFIPGGVSHLFALTWTTAYLKT